VNRHCYLLIPTIIIAATSQAGAKPEVILENSFASVNGSVPYSALKAGDAPYIFYGTTASGGAYGLGAVYEFNSKIGTVIIKDSFDGKNGASPLASLAFGGGGLFYGTAWSGGANGLGSVFEFNSATGLITLKDSFAGSNGSSPYAPLTAAGVAFIMAQFAMEGPEIKVEYLRSTLPPVLYPLRTALQDQMALAQLQRSQRMVVAFSMVRHSVGGQAIMVGFLSSTASPA
jgi:uncharacterized repeat protein (TIGR03803 family)